MALWQEDNRSNDKSWSYCCNYNIAHKSWNASLITSQIPILPEKHFIKIVEDNLLCNILLKMTMIWIVNASEFNGIIKEAAIILYVLEISNFKVISAIYEYNIWKATKKFKQLVVLIPPLKKNNYPWTRSNKKKEKANVFYYLERVCTLFNNGFQISRRAHKLINNLEIF